MKKQLMTLLSLLVLSSALVACNSSSKPDSVDNKPVDIKTVDKPAKVIPKDEASCKQQGGTWGKVGLAQFLACTIKTADGGKSCTDSSQCERSCLTDSGAAGQSSTGYCQYSNNRFGCFSEVVKGVAQPGLCVD